MDIDEARRIILMLAAAYPSWRAGEGTLALFESVLLPRDARIVEKVVLEIIRSAREFPPPVGLIYTRAEELEAEQRRLDALRNRRWLVGAIAYTPSGVRMQADATGVMRPAAELSLEPSTVKQHLIDWVSRLVEKIRDPRIVRHRSTLDAVRASDVIGRTEKAA